MDNIFKSSNPALSDRIFNSNKSTYVNTNTMSAFGTLQKFGFLMLMVFGAAAFSWNWFYQGKSVNGFLYGGLIIGLILCLIMAFKPTLAKYLAPAYGLAEGFFLGALSATINSYFELTYPNIVMQAVGLTFGVVIAMYLLFSFKIITVTNKLRSTIIIATMGIGFFYLIAMILRWFHIDMPFLYTGSTFGIIFSVVVVGIAALNLLLDFDRIQQLSHAGAPKYMEWYCAFGLLVTIVWLYMEILQLLMKLAQRKD